MQYVAEDQSADNAKKREAVKRYLFMEIEEAAIPVDPETKMDALDREAYLGFLRKRFVIMKQRAAVALSLEGRPE